MSQVWQIIETDFIELMEQDVLPVGINVFHVAKHVLDVEAAMEIVPASQWNGLYTIKLDSMNRTTYEINAYYYPNYNVILEVLFKLNQRDNRVSYTNAILDIENIIRIRLQTSTWADGIRMIDHTSTSRFVFENQQNETFAKVEIAFNVIGQANLI